MTQEIKKGKFFYAVEFMGGVVKVGVGTSVEGRVSSHKMTASLMGAGDVNEVFFVHCGCGYDHVERDAINYFLTKFEKIGSSREWFKGWITEDFKSFIYERAAIHKSATKENCKAYKSFLPDPIQWDQIHFSHVYAESVDLAIKFEKFIIDSGVYIPQFDACEGELSPFAQVMAFVFYSDKSKVFEYTAEIIAGDFTCKSVLMQLNLAGKHINEILISEGII